MALTKLCGSCGSEFTKNPRYSAEQWGRARYCSVECKADAARMTRPLCACGCGEHVAEPRHRYRHGHDYGHRAYPRRRKTVKFDGRRWYVRDRHGHKVYWARIVLSDKLGRQLHPGEIAHHINGDRTDDRPENLEAKASHGEHMSEHHKRGELHVLTFDERSRARRKIA